jgi:hypothetical protein
MIQQENQPNTPPKAVILAVKLARIGEFKDEWEEFFLTYNKRPVASKFR